LEAESLRPANYSGIAVVNISESGAAVVSRHELGEPGQTLELRFIVIDGRRSFQAECKLCYTIGEESHRLLVQPQWLHGLQFQTMRADGADFLQNLIAVHRQQKEGS
jgi:hypothetical protein